MSIKKPVMAASLLAKRLAGALKQRRELIFHALPALCVSALLTYLWLGRGLTVAYAESGLYMYRNSQTPLEMASYLWTDRISTGGANLGITIVSFSLHNVLSLMEELGLSAVQRQGVLFWMILTTSGLSIYYMVLVLFRNSDERYRVGLFASLFYVLNAYAMVYVWNRNTVTMNISYAVFPLALGLFARGLETKAPKYAFLLSLTLTVTAVWISIIPVLVPFLLLSFLLYRIATYRRDAGEILSSVKFSAMVIALWLLMNSWFLFYFLANQSALWWGFSSNYAQTFLTGFPPTDVLRLNFYFHSNGIIWSFYESPAGLLLSYVAVFIIFSEIGIRVSRGFQVWRKPSTASDGHSPVAIYFIFLAMLGVFLGTVALTPARESLTAVLQLAPFSPVISNNLVGEKAIALSALGYSVLFGLAMSSMPSRLMALKIPGQLHIRRILQRAVVWSLAIVVLGVSVWPMWTGAVFTHPAVPSSEKYGLVTVPTYYEEAYDWMNQDPTYYRILALPFVSGGMTYDWRPYGYTGSTTDFILLPRPVIMETDDSLSNDVIRAIPTYMETGRMNSVWKLLSLLNVKYIMIHEDINYTDRHTANPFMLESALNSTFVPYVNVQPMVNDQGTNLTEDLQGWSTVWGGTYANLSAVVGPDGETFISYSGESSPDYGYLAMEAKLERPANMAEARWLDISLSGNQRAKVLVILTSSGGQQMFFDGRSSPQYVVPGDDTWVNFSLPLRSPSFSSNEVDLAAVSSILVGLVELPKGVPVELRVREILLDLGSQAPVGGIRYERHFEKLAFFSLNATSGMVYTTTAFDVVNNSIEIVSKLPSLDYRPNRSLYIDRSIGDLSVLSQVTPTSGTPTIIAHRIDPTKWRIEVRSAVAPFLLAFGQSYHPAWNAYYDEPGPLGALTLSPLNSRFHYMANGYANAWFINRTGDFVISLYFAPQDSVYVGGTIATATAVILAVWLSRDYIVILLRRFRVLISPKSV